MSTAFVLIRALQNLVASARSTCHCWKSRKIQKPIVVHEESTISSRIDFDDEQEMAQTRRDEVIASLALSRLRPQSQWSSEDEGRLY